MHLHVIASGVLLLGCICVGYATAVTPDDTLLYASFPEGFMWGTATAAYQIEGGWNATGKGPNIWDTFTHQGGRVANNDTGDVACDSYNKFKTDIRLLKDMKVHHYRFSIGWSRIMTDGTNATYNPVGVQYYHSLIDELIANGIKPMVTLYHWDLPQALQDQGGWLNDTIIEKFKVYAQVMYQEYGSKVPLWITFNEPFVFCWLGYGIGIHAPGFSSNPGTEPYMCIHNVIRSHAKAYRAYDHNVYPGKVSITLDSDWKEPHDRSSASDMAAAERAMQFKLGWLAGPIFKGDYPQVMRDIVAQKSRAEGRNESRLPAFTAEEKAEINGTHDYFGLNHYTTQLIENRNRTGVSYGDDSNTHEETDPSWPSAKSSWLKVVPWGLRRLLNWIKNEYGNPPLYITENGVSDDGELNDPFRVKFYQDYINNVLKAIVEDGCDVKGYTAWSLLDNFEWSQGYTEKFGIHQVNFTDPDRPRAVKDSAKYLKKLFADNAFIAPDPASSTTPPSTNSPTTTDSDSNKTTPPSTNSPTTTDSDSNRQAPFAVGIFAALVAVLLI